ncbi:polymerase [Wufeng Crocidura attenuata orthohepadnavirus 1]|nr:polymerase [Shrew hepatitis B virus]QAS68929.1 polymerase [Shrew hepatitis B virus]UOX72952.1 polymerase [Wufeng Crocidura attenuata orthohepadnavirus 1]
MHPFSQLFQKLAISEEEPPEVLLQLLADEDLNHRAKEDLHLPVENNQPWTHKVNELLGLYHQDNYHYNPSWTLPDFSGIHLVGNLIESIQDYFGPLTSAEKRRLKLVSPCRFFPKKTKYLPLYKAIKSHYPEHILHHQFKTSAYFWKLYFSGILYLRETQSSASFIGQIYPWEHRHHGECSRPVREQSGCGSELWGLSGGGFQSSHGSGKAPFQGQSLQQTRHLWRLGFKKGKLLPGHKHFTGSRSETQATCHPSSTSFSSNQRTQSGSSPQASSTRHKKASYKFQSGFSHQLHAQARSPHNSLEQGDQEPSSCPILCFQASGSCGEFCLKSIFGEDRDWGPCPGSHDCRTCIKIPRTPRRVTGGAFLVDKNPRNTTESRLVVDFSQFSRGEQRVSWPRFAVPNLQTLTNLMPSNMQWLSLDVSAAFYHLALSPAAMPHLLVGVPGLFRGATCVSIGDVRRGDNCAMQKLHSLCNRHTWETLVLLSQELGWRQLHLCSHTSIMGFRKIPMGVGLSPFLLAQFTTALVSVVRRNFPNCFAFSYMDDLVLGAKSVHHLQSVYTSVLNFMVHLGIKINPQKTKWWGYNLHFMGLVLGPGGTLPQPQHHERALKQLKSLPVHRPLDYKIIQRLLGLLSYLAPFTMYGWSFLMPLYQVKTAFAFSSTYKRMLIINYSVLYPVSKQKSVTSYVYSDATPSTWGFCSPFDQASGIFVNDLPIYVAEAIAAALAHIYTGASLIGVDNLGVCSHKFTHLPWLLGCYLTWILRRVRFVYVPSSQNPADAVSRLRGLLLPLLPLHSHPSWGRVALGADSPPVQIHLSDRVHFASPLLNWETFKPP